MPKLQEFTAKIGDAPIGGGRRATSEDFSSGIGDVGRQIARAGEEFLSATEEKESRQALVASSEIRANYAKALDEATISGADLGELKEKMDADLAKVGENFQTRKGADHMAVYTSNAHLMFDEQANRVNVERARAEATQSSAKLVATESARLFADPSYLPHAEQAIGELLATFGGKLPPQLRAEMTANLKNQLNHAAAYSSARLAPEATIKALEEGQWDLKPEQRETLLGRAKQEIDARRVARLHERSEIEHARAEREEAAADRITKQILAGGTKQKALERIIMDDPDLQRDTRQNLISFMEHRANALKHGEGDSNKAVLKDFLLRAFAAEGDPRKLYSNAEVLAAAARGQLNTRDTLMALGWVANQKDENNRSINQNFGALFASVNASLARDPRIMQYDAQGVTTDIAIGYQRRVFDKAEELRKAGRNPNDIFDPSSKDYVGSAEFIKGSVDAAVGRAQERLRSSTPVVNTQAEYDALPVGASYTDSAGKVGTKTAKASAKTAPPSDRDRWVAATGGRLKPGQTQAQAIEEWKAGK